MNSSKIVNANILILSAVVICFEIISTRISSVVFVQNYAFIILSLAILGLSIGSVFAFYKFSGNKETNLFHTVFYYQTLAAVSLSVFVITLIIFNITNPFIYFFLLFLPFFFSGVVYSQLFKYYAEQGFNLYAFDLIGAAFGSVISLIIFKLFNAQNAVLLLSVLLFCSALCLVFRWSKMKIAATGSILFIAIVLLTFYGKNDFLGSVPIGNYPEKDFYYVYEDVNIEPQIIESRWSINGRADLVQYTNQDIVKHLFIDGAAGSQMYRFNGNIDNHDKLLNKLLLEYTNSIPFIFLQEKEKKNMLVIGPGGGKEILTGLLGEVKEITGVEVNPDFVDIVKKYKYYNGGIYTDFPNVKIVTAEGRQFVKQSNEKWDIILMSLPSTKQLQSIDNIASNENFLLTTEALKDYLKLLSPSGQLIFTVHNRWELVRLIVTSMYAFNDLGISNINALSHIIVIGADYAPTIVIKKNMFAVDDIKRIEGITKTLPKYFPPITYLPYNWENIDNSIENILFKEINNNQISLEDCIAKNKSDISPVKDDSPYFYKVEKGIPGDYLILFLSIALLSLIIIFVPIIKIKNYSKTKNEMQQLYLPLFVFMCTGMGFMVLEVSIFQKLILYLGSPTVSLSILLASILLGMGIGSYFGGKIFLDNPLKRLTLISLMIVIVGVVLFLSYQPLLNELMSYTQVFCSIVCFFLILPFGFLLGIPFPTGIQILKQNKMEKYIPWMYGVNGILTVLGSISAVILSMTFGFNITFLTGLAIYFILFIILIKYSYGSLPKTIASISEH
jgi:hypothetical protein